jgi:hypothetical protein
MFFAPNRTDKTISSAAAAGAAAKIAAAAEKLTRIKATHLTE